MLSTFCQFFTNVLVFVRGTLWFPFHLQPLPFRGGDLPGYSMEVRAYGLPCGASKGGAINGDSGLVQRVT